MKMPKKKSQKKSLNASNPSTGGGGDTQFVQDERFSKIHTDPRFRRVGGKKNQVKVDKRFKGMFEKREFAVVGDVDKYGRKREQNTRDALKKYYRLASDSEEEDQENNDEAASIPVEGKNKPLKSKRSQGKKRVDKDGPNETSSEDEDTSVSHRQDESRKMFPAAYGLASVGDTSSDDDDDDDEHLSFGTSKRKKDFDSSSEDDDDFIDITDDEDDESNLEDDIEYGEETERIAVMGCDWSKIRAVDLLVLFQSFANTTQGGFLHSVTIYPSNYGLQQMKKDELGPGNVFDNKVEKENKEEEVQDQIVNVSADVFQKLKEEARQAEKLRKYEQQKLRYYYAVAVFDSAKTAATVYKHCDGLELESTANRLDLRFVPEDTEFSNPPKETASTVPADYRAPNWATKALQHTKVELTWDVADHRRTQLLTQHTVAKLNKTKKLKEDQIPDEDDFAAYLASDSSSSEDGHDLEDDDDDDDDGKSRGKEKSRHAYRNMLTRLMGGNANPSSSGGDHEEEEEFGDMEISFTPGLTEDVKDMVQRKQDQEKEGSANAEKGAWELYLEKRARKRKEKKMKREKAMTQNGLQHPDKIKSQDDTVEKPTQEELDLMLLDVPTEMKKRDHQAFHPKEVTPSEEESKRSSSKGGKKSKNKKNQKGTEFQTDWEDDRFKAVFTTSEFARDPTHPQFDGQHADNDVKQKYAQEKLQKKTTASKHQKKGDHDIADLAATVKRRFEKISAPSEHQDRIRKAKKSVQLATKKASRSNKRAKHGNL